MGDFKGTRRDVLTGGGVAAMAAAFMGAPSAASAADGDWGRPRKLVWVSQALGDWDGALQVGMRDFCGMVGWSYQRLGNPDYSPENHVEQVNNAIASGADVIVTELESQALVPAFERAIESGIIMVIADQGIVAEAEALGLGVIGEDGLAAGFINGTQAATFAHEQGKTEGMIVIGNGNPGTDLVEARVQGSKNGIDAYNEANGTKFAHESFPSSEFGDLTESIQKWTAKFDLHGDNLVAGIGSGNAIPIVNAAQERGLKPGQLVIGSLDIPPAHQKAIAEGWMQWGIDQHFYLMGFYAAASAWARAERLFPYRIIRTGGELIRKENLDAVVARTDLWIAKAKEYGII